MEIEKNKVYLGDAITTIKSFPDESVDCVITSPPYYGLRDYGVTGQIGLEESPEQYIAKLVELFRDVRRVLKRNGTCWVNLGDSYCGTGDKGEWKDPKNPNGRNGQGVSRNKIVDGCKRKDLIGIPWMFAFAMRADGWYLRQDIIWSKPNPMPESVTDRCVKSHEYIFLFSKTQKYYFDYEAIQEEALTQNDPRIGKREEYNGKRDGKDGEGQRAFVSLKTKPRTKNAQYDGQKTNTIHQRREDGETYECYVVRNKRDVWTVNTKPNPEAHFATYPEELITPCVLAGCPEGGIVLDPFMGSGTTGIVARKLDRNYIGVELNPEYQRMAKRRIFNEGENLFNQE